VYDGAIEGTLHWLKNMMAADGEEDVSAVDTIREMWCKNLEQECETYRT